MSRVVASLHRPEGAAGAPSTGPWWDRAAALTLRLDAESPPTGWYRFGEGLLALHSEFEPLMSELRDHYGECALGAHPPAGPLPRAHCTVLGCDNDRLALVRFDDPAGTDAFDAALFLLKHPANDPAYIDDPRFAGPPAGRRLIVEASTGVPVVAARGNVALIDWRRTPIPFLGQLVIRSTMVLQRGLLFAHAASIGIRLPSAARGAGILLVGPSGAGKTTTALTLASRGHEFFGDDVAAIRVAQAEILPFWRTAHVRPGPHARALAPHLASGTWDAPYSDGKPRLRMRVGDAFPHSTAAVPLRAVFLLRGFAPVPRLEVFKPTPQAFGPTSRFALNTTLAVAWATTPALRLLQFMLFVRLLERVHCAWLDAGAPDATADLVESTLASLELTPQEA